MAKNNSGEVGHWHMHIQESLNKKWSNLCSSQLWCNYQWHPQCSRLEFRITLSKVLLQNTQRFFIRYSCTLFKHTLICETSPCEIDLQNLFQKGSSHISMYWLRPHSGCQLFWIIWRRVSRAYQHPTQTHPCSTTLNRAGNIIISQVCIKIYSSSNTIIAHHGKKRRCHEIHLFMQQKWKLKSFDSQ